MGTLTRQQQQVQHSLQNREDLYLVFKKREYVQEVWETGLLEELLKKDRKQRAIIVSEDTSLLERLEGRVSKLNAKIGVTLLSEAECETEQARRQVIVSGISDIGLLESRVELKRVSHLIVESTSNMTQEEERRLCHLICQIEEHQDIASTRNKKFQFLILTQVKNDPLLKQVGVRFQNIGTVPRDRLGETEHLKINLVYRQRLSVVPGLVGEYAGNKGAVVMVDNQEDQLRLAELLLQQGITCEVINGSTTGVQREFSLEMMARGRSKVLLVSSALPWTREEGRQANAALLVHLSGVKLFSQYLWRLNHLLSPDPGVPGRVINFYSPASLGRLSRLQGQCNLLFKRIGIPCPQRLLANKTSALITHLRTLCPSKAFLKQGREILAENPPCLSLSKVFSLALKTTQCPVPLSFASATPNCVSHLVSFGTPVTTPKRARAWCHTNLALETRSIKKVKLCNNLKGALIDYPKGQCALKEIRSEKSLKGLLDDNTAHWQQVKDRTEGHTRLLRTKQHLLFQAKEQHESQPSAVAAITRLSPEVQTRDLKAFLEEKGVKYVSLVLEKDKAGSQALVTFQEEGAAAELVQLSKSRLKGSRVKIRLIN